MAYGRGKMLGASINPQLMIQDYSGFVNAAKTRAEGLTKLGEGIISGASSIASGMMQGKEMTKAATMAKKTASQQIDGMISLYGDTMPEIKPLLEQEKAMINDPGLSLLEQGKLASGLSERINNLVNMQTSALNMQMGQEKLRQLRMQPAASGNDYYTVGQGGLNNP